MNNTLKPVKLPRLLAILIYDSLIILALLLSAVSLLFILFTLFNINYPHPGNTYFRIYLLGVIFSYYHISWAYIAKGQTIGMRAWDVILDNNMRPFTLIQSILRIFGGLTGFFAFGLGYLLLYVNKNHKTLADYLSDSQYKLNKI